MDIGAASRALPGQTVCGDHHAVVRQDQLTLVVVADGVGHGPQAATAAQAACDLVMSQPGLGLTDLMRTCDARLRGTRGAAVTLLRIDEKSNRLYHIGVGNVEAVARSASSIRPICVPGVVGGSIRKLFEQSFVLTRGDCLVCFTDGISSRFNIDQYRQRDAQRVAQSILQDWGKIHDDATCVVILY